MRRWISCALFGLLLVPGWAENKPVGVTCIASVGVPPVVRNEGLTELVGDIVLNCNGGTPTPAGQVIPTATFSLTLNTQVTSRLINTAGQSEALLLIDEPSSAANPVAINLCAKPSGCPVISNGTGLNNFNASSGRPNAFSGVASGNSVAFTGIPLLAPVTSGAVRIYRITNVRANVAGLSPGGNQASIGQVTFPPVLASTAITESSGTQVPVTNGSSPSNPHGPNVVAFPTQGSTIQFGYNPTTATAGPTPFTIFLGAQGNGPNAFQAASPESSLTDPFAVSPTSTIPAPRGFESGTVIPNPFGGPPIGAADHGTILQLSLIVPPGVSASIPGLVTLGAGSLLWSAPNVPFGSTISATADQTGSIEFFGLVTQSPGQTSSTGFQMPVTISGDFPQLPFNIQARLFYAPGLTPINTLAFSNLFPGIPAFNGTSLDGTQPLNTDTVGTVVSSSAPGDLSFLIGGQPGSIDSIQLSSGPIGSTTAGFSQIALPTAMDISLVSSGAPISSLTVTKDPSATWLNLFLNRNTTPASASLSFDPNAKPGNYSTKLMVTSPNLSAPFTVPVTFTSSSAPWFTVWDFTNAASNVGNAVAPGETFMIHLHNFEPGTPASGSPTSGTAPTTLDKTQVQFDSEAAKLIAVQELAQKFRFERVTEQSTSTDWVVVGFAPFDLAGKTTTQVQVVYNGIKSRPVSLPVLDAVPGVFTVNTNGTGQAMVINSDNSPNSDSHRATRGSLVTLLATGTGLLTPPGKDGAVTGSAAPKVSLPVKVFLDGKLVTSSTRAAVKDYEEIDAIKIRIPTNARANADLPVMIQVGDKVSQPGVTIAVK